MAFLHALGTFPLLIGFLSQVVVLFSALKRAAKPEVVQASLLMVALGLITAALLLRPKSPPDLIPDLLGCAAALLLFAPAVEAGRKLWAERKTGGAQPKP